MDQVPDFPRLDASTRVRLTREWSAPAWAGTGERLIAVQREMEDSLANYYAERIRELDAKNGQTPEGKAKTVKRAETLGEALRLRVRVSGADGRLTRTGELSAVLAESDKSEIETVTIKNETQFTNLPVVEIALQRSPKEGHAIRLKVSGPDRQWVGGAAELLSAELQKSVPWWSFLRRGIVSIAMALLLAWGVAGLLLATVPEDPADVWWTAAFMSSLLAMPVAIFVHIVMISVFPGFEVLEPGSASQGRKVLGALVTLFGVGLSIAGLILGVMAL